MNITAMLQLVMAMLTSLVSMAKLNPQIVNTPQFQSSVVQTTQMAQDVIQQVISSNIGQGGGTGTSSGVSSPQPIAINQPIGGPAQAPIQVQATSTPTLNPYCTLTAIKLSQGDTDKQDKENEQAGITTRGPYYDVSWILNDIPTSTRGKLLDNGNDIGVGLINQGVGRFPNQNKVRISYDFKNSIGADFGGVKCYATSS